MDREADAPHPSRLMSVFQELGVISPAEQPEGSTVSPPAAMPTGRSFTDDTRLEGTCNCGSVTYAVTGAPKRIGLCHCTDCRQESGSAFTYFAVWPAEKFETSGETAMHHGRRFCPLCGSRLFSADETEAEIKLGSLKDAPTDLRPSYELWIKRREPWLRPVEGAEQFIEDRTR
jgi:hypothetical protein